MDEDGVDLWRMGEEEGGREIHIGCWGVNPGEGCFILSDWPHSSGHQQVFQGR